MATLPPPPSSSAVKAAPLPVAVPVAAAVQAPVVAAVATPAAAPVAAPVAADCKAPVWGAKDLAVPTIAGQDPIALLNEIVGFIASKGIDIAVLVEGFCGTPKTSYPSTKYGRAAYALGNSITSIHKNHGQLSKTRTARTAKPRVSKVEKFKSGIEALAKQFGGMDKIQAVLGADFLKSLGV